MDDVVVRVEGMERPECNGMYAVAGQRNGRHAFNKRDGSEGALYYDGSHWKCCQSGRGTSEEGWNYSQRPEDDVVAWARRLPPMGAWTQDRATNESRVDYSRVRLSIVPAEQLGGGGDGAETRPDRRKDFLESGQSGGGSFSFSKEGEATAEEAAEEGGEASEPSAAAEEDRA